MKFKSYNGAVRSSEKDFETLHLGAFATPGLFLAQGPVVLTAEFGLGNEPFLAGGFRRQEGTGKGRICAKSNEHTARAVLQR
jgi:hypothetical protein